MSVLPERILLATDGSEDAVRATEAASDLATRIGAAGGSVAKAHLRKGRTSNEVIALCKEIDVGLLVIGSRGLGTVQRILMGSQSEEIVHRAQVPVLVLTGA